MSIRIECPTCRTTLKALDELAGRRVRCKACNSVISIPQAELTSSHQLKPDRELSSEDTDLPELPPISRRKLSGEKAKQAPRKEREEKQRNRMSAGVRVKSLGLVSLLIGCVLMLGIATWYVSSWTSRKSDSVTQREQVKYEGKTTSEWLVEMRGNLYEKEERLLKDASDQSVSSMRQKSQLKLYEKLHDLRRGNAHLFIGADPAAVPDLLEELASGDPRSSDLARRILKQFNKSTKPHLDDLIHGLGHMNSEVQTFCIRSIALYELQGTPAIPAICDWAEAADDQVRYEAATTLALMGPDGIEPLITILNKETELYRDRIFYGFERAASDDEKGFATALPAVKMLFGKLEMSPKQHAQLLGLLEKCGPPDARTVAICLAEVDSPDDVWMKASRLLSLAGELPVKPILTRLPQENGERSFRLIQVLGSIGPPANEAVPYLLSVARDAKLDLPPEQNGGVWAISALSQIGPPSANVPTNDLVALLPVLCELTKRGHYSSAAEICLWIVPKLLDDPKSAKAHEVCVREMAERFEKHIAGVNASANQQYNTVTKIFDKGELKREQSANLTAQNRANAQRDFDTAKKYEKMVEGLYQLLAMIRS